MGKTKTLNNLKSIFVHSYKWRNTDLFGKSENFSFTFLSSFNIILVIISIVIIICFGENINEASLDSILTFTSIFATLIIPVLILVYEKFANNPNKHLTSIEQKSSFAQKRLKIHQNFTKRFIFTTLENVFIATILIIMIIIYKSFLYNQLNTNILNYSIDLSFSLDSFLIFFKNLSIVLIKCMFLMLFLKFIWFLIYSIGALGDFFIESLKESK